MSDFLAFVLDYLRRAVILLVPAALVCGAGLALWAKRFQKKHPGEKFPWGKALLLMALIGYLAVVCFVTLVRGGHMGTRAANLHLFRAWREAWNNFSQRSWLNVLLNIAMFVPLGVLLPLLWEKFRRWYGMLAAGFSVSLVIEAVQYLAHRGIFDVDDLAANTLGAMVGFWLVMVLVCLRRGEVKKGLSHAGALCLTAVAIGGIFLAYDVREYGNLPEAPAMRVNTKDIQWMECCPLAETADPVEIYQTDVLTKEECTDFGRAFLENVGETQPDVTIYNEEVYLRSGNRWIEVFYSGGRYTFADRRDERETPEAGRADEETIRRALEECGVALPAQAVYTAEENGHVFRLDRYVQGDMMLDGAVTVQWEDGFGIREIDNGLLTLRRHGTAEIRSPKEAVQRVKSGHLYSGDWLERKSPKQIEIRSCTLSWQVDTKGFYQPVYLFTVEAVDGSYADTILIPAI